MAILQYTVLPGQRNAMTIPTGRPGGTFVHHHESTKEPIQFYADSDGFLPLHVYPPMNGSLHFMDLTLTGEDTTVVLKLRSSSEETDEFPFHQVVDHKDRKGRLRPALTLEEAMNLSNHDLVRRGYRPRPILEGGQVCEQWLKAVQTPMRHLEPISIPRRTIRHKELRIESNADTEFPAYITSPNWCGIDVRSSSGRYDYIVGSWTMPQILDYPWRRDINFTQLIHNEVAIWVGFDGGDGTSDVVQTGVNYSVDNWHMYYDIAWKVVSPYAWAETYPLLPSRLQQVTPLLGQEITASIWIEPDPPIVPSHTVAHTIIEDSSTYTVAVIDMPLSGIPLRALEAEWIVEAPTKVDSNGNQSPASLAHFTPFQLTSAFVRREGALIGQPWASEGNSNVINMMEGATDVRAICSPNTPDAMSFQWYSF